MVCVLEFLRFVKERNYREAKCCVLNFELIHLDRKFKKVDSLQVSQSFPRCCKI